jgi:PHD/YefM family antitoxin component YafN of YafNO toxin-antitoxin module
MVAYKSNEMMSSTDVAKNFGAVLSKLSNHEVDKICVLRNNKPEAVVLSALEYEQLSDYRYWNTLSEKEYLQKALESSENSRSFTIEEVDAYLQRVIESYER